MDFFPAVFSPLTVLISAGSSNVIMFTRLVLTNTDLLHLVQQTLNLSGNKMLEQGKPKDFFKKHIISV